jgi:hypothetical protein
MTQPHGSFISTTLKRTALYGLLAVTLHITGGPLRELAADDGITRITSAPVGYCEISEGGPYDPDFLNPDRSFGYGPGRIPFDRWYYLRRALGYKRIYPADVRYSDPRDRRVYSAAGYGVPLAVPLPSNVIYQYNYSTGPQASRVTPVSRPAP